MQTSEARNESKQHVQHGVVNILADLTGAIAFLVEFVYYVAGEEPDSKVDPRAKHGNIRNDLN